MGVFAITDGVSLSVAPQDILWVVGSVPCLCRDRDFSQNQGVIFQYGMLRGSGPTYREAAFSCFLTAVEQDGRICGCCCFQRTYSVTIQSP